MTKKTLLLALLALLIQPLSTRAEEDTQARKPDTVQAGAYYYRGSDGLMHAGRYMTTVGSDGCGLGVTRAEDGRTTVSLITPGIIVTRE
jgi:hypothetical protein